MLTVDADVVRTEARLAGDLEAIGIMSSLPGASVALLPLVPVLARMEQAGVKIDKAVLAEMSVRIAAAEIDVDVVEDAVVGARVAGAAGAGDALAIALFGQAGDAGTRDRLGDADGVGELEGEDDGRVVALVLICVALGEVRD